MLEQTLQDKDCHVGGSSSGIGAEIGRELASRGANVILNYPFSNLREEADRLAASLPTKSIAVEANISTIEGPRRLVNAAVKEFGRIDILVNNAALAVNKPFEEQTLDDWDLLVNLKRTRHISAYSEYATVSSRARRPHCQYSLNIFARGSSDADDLRWQQGHGG